MVSTCDHYERGVYVRAVPRTAPPPRQPSARRRGTYVATRAKKKAIDFRYSLAKSSSSTTSTRRSPDSHFETND